jgi:TonB family protein
MVAKEVLSSVKFLTFRDVFMRTILPAIMALCGLLFNGCATITSDQNNTWYAGTTHTGTINVSGLIWNCSGGTCLLKGLPGNGLNMAVCQELSNKVGGLDYYYNDSGMTWSKTQNRSLLDQCNAFSHDHHEVQELSGQYDTPIQYIKRENIKYPASLVKSGHGGNATIEFTVNQQGHVQNLVVIKTTHPALGEAAIDALLKSQFRPAQKQGKPIESEAQQVFQFKMRSSRSPDSYEISNHDKQNLLPEFQYEIPPKIKLTVAPVYPSGLLQSKTTGTAKVKFIVDKEGHVSYSSIVSASHPDFGKSTKAMIDSWIFEPATKAGQPTLALLIKEQEFDTDGTGETLISQNTQRMIDNLKTNIPIYSLQELDNIPKPLSQVKPVYPTNLLADKVTGKASIKYFIDQEGRAQLPEITTSTNDDFAWAALTALSRWRFEPPRRGAKPVVVRTETSIRFETK